MLNPFISLLEEKTVDAEFGARRWDRGVGGGGFHHRGHRGGAESTEEEDGRLFSLWRLEKLHLAPG